MRAGHVGGLQRLTCLWRTARTHHGAGCHFAGRWYSAFVLISLATGTRITAAQRGSLAEFNGALENSFNLPGNLIPTQLCNAGVCRFTGLGE